MNVLKNMNDLRYILGKNISEICDCEFVNNNESHCAHFVSHALGYTFGTRCKSRSGKGKGLGVTIKVHDIFPHCKSVGLWSDPARPLSCLAFVTVKTEVNIAAKHMGNIPKKHIGIYFDSFIYHYSNSKRKVVRQTPEEFGKHYKGEGFAVFFGSFPNS